MGGVGKKGSVQIDTLAILRGIHTCHLFDGP